MKGERIGVGAVKRDLNGALCSKCHAGAADELKASVHFTAKAPNQRIMFPGGGAHGMLDRACGLTGSSQLINFNTDVNLAECGKCHTGRYLPVMEVAFAEMFKLQKLPDPAGQAKRIVDAGLDCLICHAGEYRAVPEGTLASVAGFATAGAEAPVPAGFPRAARDDGDFDQDEKPDPILYLHEDDVEPLAPLMMDFNGDGKLDPWPTIAQDRSPAAVTSIGKTTEHTCLRCHEHARTGYKRATLFAEGYDVHATARSGPFVGAANRCTVCHTASQHKFVRGHNVGGDLAAADYPPPAIGMTDEHDLTCVQCHPADKLGMQRKGGVHDARHLDKIACETCHIPATGGITYSLFGHGAHLLFGRNAESKDTRLISADHTMATDEQDIAEDFEAYRIAPTLVWFNGGASFLAQNLAVRGTPHAKINPFKPMANGMAFDARFFLNETLTNNAGFPYNAHAMYRFYANGANAEVFQALGLLGLAPEEVRKITFADFASPDPGRQAMAMMMLFPNLIQFDKQSFGFEHYLAGTGSGRDADGNGIVDAGLPVLADMFTASNMGLRKFMGFNRPMGLPDDYQWYPFFDSPDQTISMKAPDESLMKMFFGMQAAQVPPEQLAAYLQAIKHYPAFSNGITVGGHGVRPKQEALGAGRNGCLACHGADGVLAQPVPVTRMTDDGMPMYQWKYYNVRALTDLGLATRDEDILAGRAQVDIDGNTAYVQVGGPMVLNWFRPNEGYRAAADPDSLKGTTLTADQLTTGDGPWMPALEPVTDFVPNYLVLGYARDEVIWKKKGKR